MMLESVSNPSLQLPDESATSAHELDLDLSESIFLVGGYDGTLWLPALDLYSPLHDVIKSLKPMNSARAYASAAKLNGQLYIFGGGDGSSWLILIISEIRAEPARAKNAKNSMPIAGR
ncbi:hypothetical protein Leryth_024670 [Lithospermum erythrorhizon]|nr:hypothetical protein Leryth_024670 [Lithospermum erythrorhizon]